MAKWKPAPPALKKRFAALMEPYNEIVRLRMMFGFPAAFANGKMFAGLFENKLFIRLDEKDRAAFRKLKGSAPFEPMPGKPMREYVAMAYADMGDDDAKLIPWMEKALAFAQESPSTEMKAPERKTKRSPRIMSAEKIAVRKKQALENTGDDDDDDEED